MTDTRAPRNRRRPAACVPEWRLSIYVDRELEPGEARAVDAHLEGCAACRDRVAALEGEAYALRVAFAAEGLAAATGPAPAGARGLVLGFLSAVAAGLVALTALGELLDAQFPAALAALDPLRVGAFTLVFDTIESFGNVVDIVQFIARATALLLSTTLLSAAVTRWRDRGRTLALVGFACIGLPLGWPSAAAALELRFGEESVDLPAEQVVEETWVVQAETVTIDGTLRGDLIAVAERVVVSGTVEGNLITGARRIEVNGSVGGSLVAAAERVRIGGSVARNVYAGSDQTTVAASGSIGNDLVGFGEGVEITGTVGRDALTFAEWLDLRGGVGRDLTLRVGRAEVFAGARVGGDLHATYDAQEGGVNVDPAATIGGEVTLETREEDESSMWDRYASPDYYVFRALSFAAALLFGLLLYRLAPWLFTTQLQTGGDLFRFLGLGLAGVVVTPVAVVLLGLTVIGIPVAVLGLFSFVVGLYSANLLVGALVGGALLGRSPAPGWREFARRLAVGLAIVFVALALPFVGGVLRFLALLLGFGALAERLYARARVEA